MILVRVEAGAFALKSRAVERFAFSCRAFQNNCLAEMWSSSEEGSYLRLIDCCITQL